MNVSADFPLFQLLDALTLTPKEGEHFHSALDLLSLSEAGLPVSSVKSLQQKLQLSNLSMSRILGISESTLQRRYRSNIKLSELESQTIIQLAELWTQGIDTFGDVTDFRDWLAQKNLALGDRIPLQLLASPLGREHVKEVLLRIEWGIYS